MSSTARQASATSSTCSHSSPLSPAAKAEGSTRLSRRGRWLIAAVALSLAAWALLGYVVVRLLAG